MAQIRAAQPDVVFQFHPGGLGISFMRQYQQAGLLGTIPMVVAAPSMDTTILKAIGDAAIGVNVSSQWNLDFDNAPTKNSSPHGKRNSAPNGYRRSTPAKATTPRLPSAPASKASTAIEQ